MRNKFKFKIENLIPGLANRSSIPAAGMKNFLKNRFNHRPNNNIGNWRYACNRNLTMDDFSVFCEQNLAHRRLLTNRHNKCFSFGTELNKSGQIHMDQSHTAVEWAGKFRIKSGTPIVSYSTQKFCCQLTV